MKNHAFSVSRRKFIQNAATAAIGAPLILRCSSNAPSSKNKLNHACIGVGGMGWADLQKFKEDPNGIVGMFHAPMEEVLKNEIQYPYESFFRKNKNNL